MKGLFSYFLLPMAIVTVLILLIYASVQQCYRTAANDPQIQMAGDIAAKLLKGVSSDKLLHPDSIEISQSLTPFVVFYDAGRHPISSTGYLDGRIIELPSGIFDYLNSHVVDEVTWQPRPGVRMAMVVQKVTGSQVSYVAVGRSLKQVELREYSLRLTVIIGWIICLILVALSGFIYIKK